MKKERVAWIDVARGIGIILVVYGHSLSADTLRAIIYSFHMPLFFFLSGLVFTFRPEQKFTQFLKKNSRAMLYPYFLFAAMSFILWVFMKHPSVQEAIKQFLSTFYGNGNNGLLAFNNILWFLPCLFITRLGFFLLTKKSIEKRFLLIALFLFSLVGYIISIIFPDLILFFGTETALTAIVFLGIGFLWTLLPELRKKWVSTHLLPLFILATIICLVFAVVNFSLYGFQVDLRLNRLNNYFYFYLAALGGTLATILLSQKIQHNRLIEYLGRNTLVIFAWHLLMFSYISQFLSVTGLKPILKMFPTFVSPIFYSACSIVIILVITKIVRWGMKQTMKLSKQR